MKAHWTARYLIDRSKDWLYQRLYPGAPWLGRPAIRCLLGLLKPHMSGFEAGAGRSTVWIARRVAALQSVEEDPGWFARVQEQIIQAGLGGVVHLQVVPDAENLREGYAQILATLENESLDFVLVDSEHERDYLSFALLQKLRPGGFLALDNANWYLPSESRAPNSRAAGQGPLNANWMPFYEAVSGWRSIWTSNGVTDTAFFFKPGGAPGPQ